MINVSGKSRLVRETTAPYQYNDPETGELKTEDTPIRYYCLSIADSKEHRAKIQKIADENPDELIYLSFDLAPIIADLPEIKLDGKAFPKKDGHVTQEGLERLPLINLRAMQKAIAEDVSSPKEQPVT